MFFFSWKHDLLADLVDIRISQLSGQQLRLFLLLSVDQNNKNTKDYGISCMMKTAGQLEALSFPKLKLVGGQGTLLKIERLRIPVRQAFSYGIRHIFISAHLQITHHVMLLPHAGGNHVFVVV